MRVIVQRENHKIKPVERVVCHHCGSTLRVSEDDCKRERIYKFFFPINVEYIICPVCNVKLYRIPQNFWTRDISMGIDNE